MSVSKVEHTVVNPTLWCKIDLAAAQATYVPAFNLPIHRLYHTVTGIAEWSFRAPREVHEAEHLGLDRGPVQNYPRGES